MTNNTEDALHATVQDLMNFGVRANLEELDKIYHEDLVVMDLNIEGRLVSLKKQEVLGMLREVFKDRSPEDNLWYKIHSLTVNGDRGHVLIARKIPLGGPMMHIELSIDFVFDGDRWQVMREVNFSRPDAEAA